MILADLGTLASSHQRYEAAGLEGVRPAVTVIRANPRFGSVMLKTIVLSFQEVTRVPFFGFPHLSDRSLDVI